MKYVVLTTRHHDGFALWDTKTRDFNAAKLGPCRDLLPSFVEAVRAEGLKVGFYYSVADWTHPDYPDAHARDWPTAWRDEASRQRFVAYYRAQLEELFTNYGPIDMLWYDGCFPEPTDGAEVNEFVKKLQPNILINNRNGEGWDFRCSEQAIKPAPAGTRWEACMTLNANWGWHAGDHAYKTAQDVLQLLTETAKSGGNLLLNIGPKGDGSIPAESEKIVREVGKWLERNREFLPHSTRAPFGWFNSGKLTTKGNTIYLHLFCGTGSTFCLSEIKNRVKSARYVATGEPVRFRQDEAHLWLEDLPDPLPDPLDTLIALEVEGKPEALVTQTTFWIPE
jgi:alpha-L-fucosidase